MAFVTNDGIRIHYDVEGEGPPLVLMHGLAQSLVTWRRRGFADGLTARYMLILVDARGHGLSDKPHEPEAYRSHDGVADVLSVLDDLGVSKAHYIGWSMGARTGWSMAIHHPERLRSLVLGGAAPSASDNHTSAWREALERSMEVAVAAVKPAWGELGTPDVEAEFRANDLQALHAVLSAPRLTFDHQQLLPAIALPCLLFGGEQDPLYAGAADCVDLMPNARKVTLEGYGHARLGLRLDLVLPHISEFLAGVDRDSDQ